MHRFKRTGRLEFRRYKAKPSRRPKGKREGGAVFRSLFIILTGFLFFAVWVAFGLAPVLQFRVAPEKSLSATVERIEELALNITQALPSEGAPMNAPPLH